jgi:hypothetical protein
MNAAIVANPVSPDDWEYQLDNMGVSAPIDALEAHLACCPDREMPAAIALLGFLEGHAAAESVSRE